MSNRYAAYTRLTLEYPSQRILRLYPADLARYSVAKLISEGAGAQDAIVMTGYKRVPGVSEETILSGPDSLKTFHPLHS